MCQLEGSEKFRIILTITTRYWTISKSPIKYIMPKPMNPFDILSLLFQYSLLNLYTPVINSVGFSHPLTFTIIAAHNTLSLTYLLLTVSIAYAILDKKSWLIPAIVATVWTMISINLIITLNIPINTAIAAILPHGLIEFTAIAYWTNAIRKATQGINLPKPANAPTFKDYFKAFKSPRKFATLVKTDIGVSFKTTKLSFLTLCKSLKKAYLVTLVLIAAAALIETYITPYVMLLVGNL